MTYIQPDDGQYNFLELFIGTVAVFMHEIAIDHGSSKSETAWWSWRLWILLLTNVLISLVIAYQVGSGRNTTAGWVLDLLRFSPSTDSWKPMTLAIEHMREHPDIPVYSEIFFKDHIKFQYPPSSLVVLDLFQRFSHASWATVYRIFNTVSLMFVPATGLVSYFLLLASLGKEKMSRLIARDNLLMPLCILTALFFFPLVHAYVLGQIQTMITFLVAMVLLAWQYRRKRLAGLLLGICCAMKPQWVVVLLWGCMRRQWGFSMACAGTFGTFSLVAILLYGTHNLTDYFSALSYMSHHGESYFPNQSINGLVNRFLFNGNNLYWDQDHFAPYHPMVYALTLLSGALMIAAAVFWRIRKTPSTLDLALIMLSLTVASPIVWRHHYAILLPILAIAAPIALSRQLWGKLTWVYLWLSFVLVGQLLEEPTKLTSTSHWNVLQSYQFLGAMMIFILLFQLTANRKAQQ